MHRRANAARERPQFVFAQEAWFFRLFAENRGESSRAIGFFEVLNFGLAPSHHVRAEPFGNAMQLIARVVDILGATAAFLGML